MTREPWHESLSNEALLATLHERLDALSRSVAESQANLRISLSEIMFSIKELEKQDRERNGKIDRVVRENEHTMWRLAENDKNWIEHLASVDEKIKILNKLEREYQKEKIKGGVYDQWLAWFITGITLIATSLFEILKFLGIFN